MRLADTTMQSHERIRQLLHEISARSDRFEQKFSDMNSAMEQLRKDCLAAIVQKGNPL